MKLLILMSVLVTSSVAFAKGHECEALCIVLDSQDSTLYYLDQINLTAGTTSKETHRLLKKQCQKIAKNNGFHSGSLLVDSLDYSSQRVDESESSSRVSRSDSGWISFGESRARGRQGTVYTSYQLEMGYQSSASDSYSRRDSRGRQLNIRLTPSTPSSSCVEDDEVADGNIPYVGGIIIH